MRIRKFFPRIRLSWKKTDPGTAISFKKNIYWRRERAPGVTCPQYQWLHGQQQIYPVLQVGSGKKKKKKTIRQSKTRRIRLLTSALQYKNIMEPNRKNKLYSWSSINSLTWACVLIVLAWLANLEKKKILSLHFQFPLSVSNVLLRYKKQKRTKTLKSC